MTPTTTSLLDEQVHVVRHDLQRDDLPAAFVGFLPDQFVQACRDPSTENWAAVLRAPHHVQSQVVHAAGEPVRLTSHSHNDHYVHAVHLTERRRT